MRSHQVPVQTHQLLWIMLESCLWPFSWQEKQCVCVHACRCMYCKSKCECGLHMCVWSEEWLIGASGDTGHWGILSKLWILTGTDKTAVILSHHIGLTMPLGLVRHWEDASLCISGPSVGRLSLGLSPLWWYTPMPTIKTTIPSELKIWQITPHGTPWSLQTLTNPPHFRHTVTT